MKQANEPKATESVRFDWRGWLALAWALWWGWAYMSMVIDARSSKILEWLRQAGV